MRTAGHTVQRASRQVGRFVDVTLECSCGRVFAAKRCLVEQEQAMQSAVFDEGREAAVQHIARVQEAVKTLTAERPCAA